MLLVFLALMVALMSWFAVGTGVGGGNSGVMELLFK